MGQSQTLTQRRSQAERSAATRGALLEATIASLVEDGYGLTTTSRVAERAGVSRGAHLHHFHTRQALLSAALDDLFTRRNEQLLAVADAPPAGSDPIAARLDLLWGIYNNPLFHAALALWSQSRSDPELRLHLNEVERESDRQLLSVITRLFPHMATRPDFELRVGMALGTMRGVVLLDTLQQDPQRTKRQWEFCRDELRRLFEP